MGPGYNDVRVRPWNAANTRERGPNGESYESHWKSAIDSNPSVVSITSYNEYVSIFQ